jgi:hypothetical protein
MADPLIDRRSPSDRVPRARFGTSFATSTTIPTGARGAGASLGFSLQGVPLIVVGTPLGGLAFVTFSALHAPRIRRCAGGMATQAWSPSRRRSHDESVLSPQPAGHGRRCPLGVSPSRACSPSLWHTLSSRAPPLSPLDGATFDPVWTAGSWETKESDDPSPGRQLSWVSRPRDDCGAPYAIRAGGLV